MAIVIKAILIMDNIGIGRLLIRIQLKHPDCFKPAVRRLLNTAVYSYNEGRDGDCLGRAPTDFVLGLSITIMI